MSNIILIGFMGSGKSAVGRCLQKRMGYLLLDSDREIEKLQGCSISELFKEKGEAYFRRLESEYLESLSQTAKDVILSTGGGMPLTPGNAKRMQRIGEVVYLKASVDTLYERLKRDTRRPLLQTGDKRQIIEELLAKRAPFYEEAANRIVVTDGISLEQVVDEIVTGQAQDSNRK